MRLLIQRVLEASVSVSETHVSSIGKGLLVLLGINQKDDYKLAEKMAKKLVKLRLWPEYPDQCQIKALKPLKKTEVKEMPGDALKEEAREESGIKEMVKEKEINNEKKEYEGEEQKESIEKEHTKTESASNMEESSSIKTWDKSVKDLGYEILVVSQFTLYGVLKGNKPDFHNSMGADEARKIFEFFVEKVEEEIGREKVRKGRFQEHMHVALVNDGPVTIVWEEDKEEKEGKK